MFYLYFSIFTLIASNSTSTEWAPNSGEDLVINLPYLEISPEIDVKVQQNSPPGGQLYSPLFLS